MLGKLPSSLVLKMRERPRVGETAIVPHALATVAELAFSCVYESKVGDLTTDITSRVTQLAE